jgi:hypothetical protein
MENFGGTIRKLREDRELPLRIVLHFLILTSQSLVRLGVDNASRQGNTWSNLPDIIT